jgi:hypothetical protein
MRLYVVGQEYFLNTPPAHLAPVGLIGVMGTVFLAWKIKRWEPFMRKWWLHRPVVLGAGAARQWQNSVTLFTSTVSLASQSVYLTPLTFSYHINRYHTTPSTPLRYIPSALPHTRSSLPRHQRPSPSLQAPPTPPTS